ncbi:MAG: response regulator [bacterium]
MLKNSIQQTGSFNFQRVPRLDASIEDLWDVLPSALWKTSKEGLILGANQAAKDLLGMTREELIGRVAGEFFLDLEFQGLTSTVLQTGKLDNMLSGFRCRDGSTREVMISIRPAVGDESFFLSITDHSVQRRIEDHAFANAPLLQRPAEIFFIQTPDGVVTQWSRGAEDFFGFKRDDVLGKEFLSRIHLPSEIAENALQTVLDVGEWVGLTTVRCEDGREAEMQMRWLLLQRAVGDPVSILVIAEDAVDWRELRDERLRSHRHECVGMLSGGIAHDLNNVLQPVSMFLDLLRQRLLDPESREMLDNVGANLHRATELVRQILTFSSGVRIEQQDVKVGEIIAEISNFIRPTFPKLIQVQVSVQKDVPAITGNATQLQQVLLNLCVNARDAMPQGGILKIVAAKVIIDEQMAKIHPEAQLGTYVQITVSDTGLGIPKQIRKKIFEPFFTTKKPDKGTGLGLATSLGILRNHGGFLTLDTEEGCGSSFHIFLPANSSVPEHYPATPETIENPDQSGQGETILLVDDEPTVLKVMKRSLEKSGYHIISAANGEEGLALYSRYRPDIRLVITDMSMPGMDGPELVAKLKKIKPSVKIICTSGLGSSASKNSAHELGVESVLAKPCSSQILLQTIRNALSNTAKT